LLPALDVYRREFKPSAQLAQPYAMVAVNVIAADTDEEGLRLMSSLQQQFTNMLRRTRGLLPPPLADIESYWSPAEKAQASGMLRYAFAGSADTVHRALQHCVAETAADELIVAAAIFDHAARLRSYEILADVWRDLRAAPAPPAPGGWRRGDP
jgi:alkanesulfonate monooxygenase SsuD/methylene tetrahydromethanopterin reductase-like flavin-dependent oxidoreductase (luciferase family)